MFFIILVILCDTLAASTDNAVMIFEVPEQKKCDLPYPYILLENEPCQILVMNRIDIHSGQCKNALSQNIEFSNIEHDSENFQATILRVKSNDGDRWSCEFYSGPAVWRWTTKCDARFHLRTKNPVASISLNNRRMNATRTNLSITNYDAEVIYTFDDDETVFINCKPSLPRRPGSTMMRYFNSTGGTVLETSESSDNISITIKLAQEDHYNYIDCIYINKDNDISVTRLIFQSQNSYTKNSVMHWIWLTAIIGMLIVVIIIAFIVKHKLNKLQRQPSDMNNVNSPNSGDGSLPHPTQWNEANYTESRETEDNEPDYENRVAINKKRKSKNKIKKKTSIYDSDSDYVNVEFTNGNVVMEPTLNYADILTVNNKNKYKKTDRQTALYSRVQFTEASTDDSNYERMSMIEGPSYVNSHAVKETVEPAYCEVQVQARN